ncbi:hypothetical protein WICANDRAFT_60570 [Wickerhamomyces anomalus NRRL Y-366-8]|uniref:1-acyl-sn-glycerol-3-phosphate acyltransferase n=1 Tax=Wickerhamomyces anomalus (strain ATCC 58044 / CBS 1984 / NCYC 433 / NRRL Y-366-8) TaxID=683960 RepID=A0A1E3PAS8_WICAA|nr:uncharacterized protein WICANDRAFT_60570 [Wickerhamomyces anomalus NRRL Y-366-8]ODQ62513.1 hypothetical protein WICANDRAFT_60570 [Wickerhamomyces anomalus NRRL Y-366-8]
MGFFKSLKFYTKTVLAATILGGCALYGVLASIALTLVGKRHLAQWTTARVFYYTFSSLLGIRIKLINGERLDKLPAILISNHQSALDILILGRIFPKGCVVTSKKSLKYVPFLGWFMALSGTFFLDRSNREKSVKTLNKALANLKEKKRGLFIFPEGTRSYCKTPEMLPFKKGAFHLAQQAEIPVIPLIVSVTSPLLDASTKSFECGEITIKVLEPISTKDLKKEDVGAFSAKIRETMLEELKTIGLSTIDGQTPESYETFPNETDEFTTDDPEVTVERTSLLSKSSETQRSS